MLSFVDGKKWRGTPEELERYEHLDAVVALSCHDYEPVDRIDLPHGGKWRVAY